MPDQAAAGPISGKLTGTARNSLPWLIVFDLDGTLIDSSRDLAFSVNVALAQVGASPLPYDLIATFIGDGAAVLIRRALAASLSGSPVRSDDDHLFSSTHAAFFASYRKHKLDTTKPYPGVIESLREMRRRAPNLLMAVLTNKPTRPAREICDALELSPFFFANYGGDSFLTKKPEPEGLLTILSEGRVLSRNVRTDPAGVVMVGDAGPDVLVARAVGARCLGCLYGLAPDELIRNRPDQLVRDASEWPDALIPLL